MLKALRSIAPNKTHKQAKSAYDRCIAVTSAGRAVADKVKVAHWLAEHSALTLDQLDLAKQITALALFVHEVQSSAARIVRPRRVEEIGMRSHSNFCHFA